MKKTIQKLMAVLLAVAMVCAMAIPAFADDTKENIQDHNSFSGFQIFKGDVEGNKISNADWGQSIAADSKNFLAQLKEDTTLHDEFKDANTVQDVLAVISTWNNSDDNSIAFARFVCKYLYPDANANPKPFAEGNHSLTFSQAGYYLIVDTTDFSSGDDYHAYNSFMLKVTQANYVFDVTPKVEKPSVKKEVYDNQDGTSNNAGFGSSADHAINEPFQFKLTATLPASTYKAYDYYEKYTVTFHDTLSEGITFDRLDKVEITNGDGSTPQVINENKYTLYSDSSPFTLGIDNVKTCVSGIDLNKGATITVTYTAHLNEKAYVNTVTNGDTKNTNKVYLTYSNNPRINTSVGRTPESEVRVYTYQLNNTKYKNSVADENKLEGAGFRLYSDAACNDTDEIKLKKNTTDGTYSRYFGDGAGEQMFSDDKGQFNVKGLDAGTYYLKETTTPDGFNTCPVTTVVIKANHTENNVDLTGSTINSEGVGASGLSTTIVNKQGTTLPSTGGIGTTLFYVIGGGLMVAAIVLLVTKKRMENK